jgi:hypothetical protein
MVNAAAKVLKQSEENEVEYVDPISAKASGSTDHIASVTDEDMLTDGFMFELFDRRFEGDQRGT